MWPDMCLFFLFVCSFLGPILSSFSLHLLCSDYISFAPFSPVRSFALVFLLFAHMSVSFSPPFNCSPFLMWSFAPWLYHRKTCPALHRLFTAAIPPPVSLLFHSGLSLFLRVFSYFLYLLTPYTDMLVPSESFGPPFHGLIFFPMPHGAPHLCVAILDPSKPRPSSTHLLSDIPEFRYPITTKSAFRV